MRSPVCVVLTFCYQVENVLVPLDELKEMIKHKPCPVERLEGIFDRYSYTTFSVFDLYKSLLMLFRLCTRSLNVPLLHFCKQPSRGQMKRSIMQIQCLGSGGS